MSSSTEPAAADRATPTRVLRVLLRADPWVMKEWAKVSCTPDGHAHSVDVARHVARLHCIDDSMHAVSHIAAWCWVLHLAPPEPLPRHVGSASCGYVHRHQRTSLCK